MAKPRKFSLPTFKSRTNKQDTEEFLMPTNNTATNGPNSPSHNSPASQNSPSLLNLQQQSQQEKNRSADNNSNTLLTPSSTSATSASVSSSSSSIGSVNNNENNNNNGRTRKLSSSASSSPASHEGGNQSSSSDLIMKGAGAGTLLVPNMMEDSNSSSPRSGGSTSPRVISNNSSTRKSKTPPTLSPSSPRSNFFQWLIGRAKTSELPETKENELKIGLFGCEGSGKSTLFKQCEKIFGGGYSEKAVFHSTTFIQQNLVEVLKGLFEGILKEQESSVDIALDWTITQKMKNFLSKHTSDKFIGDKVLDSSTWYDILQDSRIKGILENIHEYRYLNYSIGNCIEYYVEEYERLTSPQYRATEKDYITFQQRTTGVVSRVYSHKNTSITLMDIGGVRTERKKWSLMMKCCQALVYVSSLSEFDEVCWEDITTNRFIEDLTTFKEWLKNDSIKNQPVFLIFTNIDRFKKKIQSPNKLSILNSLLSIDTNSANNASCDFYLDCITKKFKEVDQDNRVCDIIVANSFDSEDIGSKMSQVFDKILDTHNVNNK